MENSQWYDPGHTLTHNALINMVIGPRGSGKTYGLKNLAVRNWVKKQEQFIYLRRYQAELDLVQQMLFSDINKNLTTPVEWGKGGHYKIDDEIVGWPYALSGSASLKSASFPDVTLIIFDEFIIDTTQSFSRYLKNEVELFLNFYETVARSRDNVRAFLLANSLSFVNPYSIYWNLKNNGKQFVKSKNGLVLCELYQNTEFTKMKQQTKFGQLIEGTRFAEMSVQNKFILDDDTFLAKRPANSRYYCGVKINDKLYGIWYYGQIFYVDKAHDPTFTTIAYDLESHNEDTYFGKRSQLLQPWFRAFKRGLVRFGDEFIKADCLMILGGTY